MGIQYRIREYINKRKNYSEDMSATKMLYERRDEMILGTPEQKTIPNKVNLHYWTNGVFENLGDYLSAVVVKHFAPKTEWGTDGIKHLYAVGSILGFGCQDAVVWGSGMLYPYKPYLERIKLAALDIRCVRGPLTRQQLLKAKKKCPEIYGDPVLLMPMIYETDIVEKKYEVSYIPHFNDDQPERIHNISMKTVDYKYVIDEIVKSRKIISSSLHGIILAESYKVPAVLCLRKGSNEFKYRDYYYSTGRYEFPIARSVEEALETEPCHLPELSGLRDNLLKTFPYDLWEG